MDLPFAMRYPYELYLSLLSLRTYEDKGSQNLQVLYKKIYFSISGKVLWTFQLVLQRSILLVASQVL